MSVPDITGDRTAFMQGRVKEEMLDLLGSEGESTTILRNVGNCSQNDKESHPSQRSPSLTLS